MSTKTDPKMDPPKKPRQEFVRTHSIRLPTPPPDPNENILEEATALSKETMDKENEFLEYLNSLPVPTREKGVKASFAPAMAAEDAFDHLDKLYKVMEQLLNLRDQNAKLQRRIRDLERNRKLQDMHRKIAGAVLRGEDTEIPEISDDYILAEAFLDNMFARNKRHSKTKSNKGRHCSVASDEGFKTLEQEPYITRNNSKKSLTDLPKKNAKVSKWTKVKAAFKWEKASPTVSGAKSQDSGIGGMLPVNNELARYLRVPSCAETNEGVSPADSVLSGSWQGTHGLSTPGTVSSASSTDDLNTSILSEHRSVSRTGSAGTNIKVKHYGTSQVSDEEEGERRSRSLDYSVSFPLDTSHPTKDDLIKLQASKAHKTPWGKVKDIIQTRKDSLRKKQHRLSARSDDYRMEWSAGSDQEDVFEPPKHEDDFPTVTITNTDEIKPERNESVLETQNSQNNDEEKGQIKNNTGSPRANRRESKWTKVKKAFLTSSQKMEQDEPQSVPASPTSKQSFFYDIPNTCKEEYCCSNIPRRKISDDDIKSKKLQEEIYKSYEQLQKKLSLEFQEKLHEWEKVKNATTTNTITNTTSSSEEQRDPEFQRKMDEWEKIKHSEKKKGTQMTSEENLPPDFKKKLQEWEKIKKGTKEEPKKDDKKKTDWQLWRSTSTQPKDNLQLGQPDSRQLSEDFLKKLDEWKQIKANRDQYDEYRKSIKENKSPSPSLTRKGSNKVTRQSKKYKSQEEKELQWLEKELQKIDREKQRLEREREKFLGREERLAKLRKTVGTSQHKKDVLVQTSTGFFWFEGISRKFTQRLYEWEKAKGIGPEASTIALLNTGIKQNYPEVDPSKNPPVNSNPIPRIKLQRSKSMDSVTNTFEGSLVTHQPSSLSLNDMEELEMQCLAGSPATSVHNLDESEFLDDGEPEAMLVEVEDLVEETAAPLETEIEEKKHVAVYQTEMENLCESERCEAPQVRRSGSARAMSSYNIIQDTLILLNQIIVSETKAQKNENKLESLFSSTDTHIDKSTGAIPKRSYLELENKKYLKDSLEQHYRQQDDIGLRLHNKFQLLQEANTAVLKNAENTGISGAQLEDTIETMQDLSSEVVATAEKLKNLFSTRNKEFSNEATINKYTPEITELANSLTTKVLELKRSLTYMCAASDMTAPGRKKKPSIKERNHSYHRSLSNESTKRDENSTDEEQEDTEKVKIKRKSKLVKSKSEDNPNYAKIQVTSSENNRKERIERSYKITKNDEKEKFRVSESDKNELKVENVVVPTNVQYLDATSSDMVSTSPVSIFVHTTRKLFTPFASETLDFTKENETKTEIDKGKDIKENVENTVSLPPLPQSPIAQKREKIKETSPAIRIMIARYNQKLSEHENSGCKSGGSSGSNSPVAWRSPVLERRVRNQSEKYEEEVSKTNSNYSPRLAKKQVQKSASAVIMGAKKQYTIPQTPIEEVINSPKVKGILKSISVDSMKKNPEVKDFLNQEEKKEDDKPLPINQERAYKLQKAKESFFQSHSTPSTSTPTKSEEPKFPVHNRLSQVSFGSESSCDDMACSGILIKSASAGMINIEEQAYQQFRPEMHSEGYVSLPRSIKKKEDKFGISSLTSKFRRVKMRRHKDNSMNAVSALCRQSLVVDITLNNPDGKEKKKKEEKTNWLKNPTKIFRPK